MKNENEDLPENLYTATETLAENLRASEPFVFYERARDRLASDEVAQSLLEELTTLQYNIRAAQTSGGIDQKAVARLRELQNQITKNQTIMDYVNQQQKAVDSLRATNREISRLIGMDFAALTRKSTC